jgi:phage-related protein
MSNLTYYNNMKSKNEKVLILLYGEIKTPPFSSAARLEAGFLLRKLQIGELLSMPQSRPMPVIAARCHELRINDKNSIWRIVYRIDADAIVVLEVFNKKTQETPQSVIDVCKNRIKNYDAD